MKINLTGTSLLIVLPLAACLAGCTTNGGKGGISPGIGIGAGSATSLVLSGPPIDLELRPRWHVAHPAVTDGPSGYSPGQIRHAYGFDQFAGGGGGQIIAIVDAYGSATIQSDLDTFATAYGLPSTTVQILYPGGKPMAVNTSWNLETSLDVEWAHAIAPQAAIVLVVAKTAGMSDLLVALNAAALTGARQISMSWGSPEFFGESFFDVYFNRPGITFTASAGDSGAGVDWPASSPYVLSVGGTTMRLDSLGNVTAEEVAWTGSGGGVSAYQPRPAYQNGWHTNSGRGVPDVSYNADPQTGYSVYLGSYAKTKGWLKVGGTSAGAPQWAALSALVNASHPATGTSLGVPVYDAAGANYGFYYLDILLGNNDRYEAGRGYDFVTGLGPPIANRLLPALGSFSANITGR